MVDLQPVNGTRCRNAKFTQYTLLKDKVLDNHTLDRLKKDQNITACNPRTHMQISVLHAQRCRIIYR